MNVKKKFIDGTKALNNVSLNIEKSDVVSIIGPSGAGKSTLIRCINLLVIPEKGDVLIEGVSIVTSKKPEKIRQKIGMVFQEYSLFQHLTVMENLTLGPIKLLKENRQIAEGKAKLTLERVGLEDKVNAIPIELSGGQKQRVAIARCLMMNPEIILFDEPTSALDPIMTNEILLVIDKLSKEGMTMIIVTHEMKFAKNASTKVVYMEDGKIVEEGASQIIFDAPKNNKTRRFINYEMQSNQVKAQ